MTEDTTKFVERIAINLTKGMTVFVSPQDADLAAFKWSALISANGQVYAHRTVDGKKVYLGRTIMARKMKENGEVFKKGQRCYHVNGDTTDKTRDNLDIHRPKKTAL